MPRLAYVIGHPIGHSISPAMHNAAFRARAIDAEYRAVDVDPAHLASWILGLRLSDDLGCNVTIPHKEAVAKAVDTLAGDAELAGAVNTVYRDPANPRRLIGSNTDTIGFRRALAEDGGISARGQRVVLLGAGGAARAIAVVVLQDGADELVIANRTPERAEAMLTRLRPLVGTCHTRAIRLDDPAMGSILARATLVVNATSVGLRTQEIPADPTPVGSGCVVMDIVYNPLTTAFL